MQAIGDISPRPGSVEHADIEKGITITYRLRDGLVSEVNANIFGCVCEQSAPFYVEVLETVVKNLLGNMGITFVINAGEENPGLIRLIGEIGNIVVVKFS